MARRRRPQSEPPSLAASSEEAITITAYHRLDPLIGLRDLPWQALGGSTSEEILAWALEHRPAVLVSDEQALQAAERDHAAKARHAAQTNNTKNT